MREILSIFLLQPYLVSLLDFYTVRPYTRENTINILLIIYYYKYYILRVLLYDQNIVIWQRILSCELQKNLLQQIFYPWHKEDLAIQSKRELQNLALVPIISFIQMMELFIGRNQALILIIIFISCLDLAQIYAIQKNIKRQKLMFPPVQIKRIYPKKNYGRARKKDFKQIQRHTVLPQRR